MANVERAASVSQRRDGWEAARGAAGVPAAEPRGSPKIWTAVRAGT